MKIKYQSSKVYVKTDSSGRIISCEGGYTTPSDLTDWVQIDEGTGDKYNLCQSHYFDGGLYTNTSPAVPRYKLVDRKPMLRTEDEIAADRDSMPEPPEPSGDLEERVAALEQAQAEIWSVQAAAIREGVNSVE